MFHMLCCWLIVSGKVDALLTYYRSMRYFNFFHGRLHSNNIICICLFQLAKNYLCQIVKYIIIYFIHQWRWRLEWLWNLIPMAMWKSCICFVGFYDQYYFIRYLYILRVNHFWMVVNFPINRLGWSFPEISNLTTITCEPLMHRYN